jgi:hypothetical protein
VLPIESTAADEYMTVLAVSHAIIIRREGNRNASHLISNSQSEPSSGAAMRASHIDTRTGAQVCLECRDGAGHTRSI